MATLYGLDNREHIQWPLQKRERGEQQAKVVSKAIDIIGLDNREHL